MSGPGFGVLLVVHVLSAVVGFGAMVATGVQGWRLQRATDEDRVAALRRYFRPGTNWAARLLYVVPLAGAGLIAESGGAYRLADRFVLVGLSVWLVAVVVAELVLWPAERRVQRALAAGWPGRPEAALQRACHRLAWTAPVMVVLFAIAFTVMMAAGTH